MKLVHNVRRVMITRVYAIELKLLIDILFLLLHIRRTVDGSHGGGLWLLSHGVSNATKKIQGGVDLLDYTARGRGCEVWKKGD